MKYFHIEQPKTGQKFVAFYSDGGGAYILKKVGDEKYIDAEGDEMGQENIEEHSTSWLPLPDNFTFWYERK